MHVAYIVFKVSFCQKLISRNEHNKSFPVKDTTILYSSHLGSLLSSQMFVTSSDVLKLPMNVTKVTKAPLSSHLPSFPPFRSPVHMPKR